MIKSIFGEEYDIEEESVDKVKDIVKKAKATNIAEASVEKQLKSNKLSLEDRLRLIRDQVYEVLKKQKNNVSTITTREALHNYISGAIAFGKIAIDTETNNSLDPLTCKLMGPCFYYPGDKQVYVPINHVNIYTNERLVDQLTEQDIKEELQRLVEAKTFIIMHNGKFDYQVIKCTCGIKLPVHFDTMIAAKLINENESAKLKDQYSEYIDPEQEKYSIAKLFANIKYEQVDPKLFALYAATDAYDTYKLYEHQLNTLTAPGYEKVYDLFTNVEMPIVEVTAEMELTGVLLDLDYCNKLAKKYHHLLDIAANNIQLELKNLEPQILEWKASAAANARGKVYYKPTKENSKWSQDKIDKTYPEKDSIGQFKYTKSKAEQLVLPIDINSNTQLPILFYDILGCKLESDENNKSVGKDELEELNRLYKLPICKAILNYRKIAKILSTYVDAIPESISITDNRVHAKFDQMGREDANVVTGRFSSSRPNLQNIPSKNPEIRLMFTAAPGKVIVGADYSAQEPRMATYLSKDPEMLKAYMEDEDLYVIIAQAMFNNEYNDNLEFYPEGTVIEENGKQVICGFKTHKNKAGKARRNAAKTMLLAIFYGMGLGTVAGRMEKSYDEAKALVENFYTKFHVLKNWMDNSIIFLKKNGYVEDFYGRRRRLSDIYLPEYEVSYKDPDKIELANFNPFINCANRHCTNKNLVYYQNICASGNLSNKKFNELKNKAIKEGIVIKANTSRIAKAERQTVNARVQGSAATLTKMAMYDIYRDAELNRLGFKMLITVHDEVLGEVDEVNAEAAAKRLSEVMINAAKRANVDVPMKCDATITSHWYSDEISMVLKDYYDKTVEGDPEKGILPISKEEAWKTLCTEHCEFTEDELRGVIFEDKLVK